MSKKNNLLCPRAFIDVRDMDTVINGELSERSEHRFVASLTYLNIAVIHSQSCYLEGSPFFTSKFEDKKQTYTGRLGWTGVECALHRYLDLAIIDHTLSTEPLNVKFTPSSSH